MNAQKEVIDKPQNREVKETFQRLKRTIEDKMFDMKQIARNTPAFEVNWVVEYEADPIGKALKDLADAVFSGNKPAAKAAAQDYKDEMKQALDAAQTLKPTLDNDDKKLVDEITAQAKREQDDPVRAGENAISAFGTRDFPDLLDQLNKDGASIINLMARMPTVKHMETISESTDLLDAANELTKKLKAIFG